MRVLGIDPGLTATGYAVVDKIGNRLTAVDWGVVRSGKGELGDRLNLIYERLIQKLTEHRPGMVSVELVFLGRNPRSALMMGHARGIALLAAAREGYPIREYAATVVKQSVVGNGRAAKQQVNFMVTKLLNLQGQKIASDASDALAIALCCLFREALNERRK